jgi:hypothetical protein
MPRSQLPRRLIDAIAQNDDVVAGTGDLIVERGRTYRPMERGTQAEEQWKQEYACLAPGRHRARRD